MRRALEHPSDLGNKFFWGLRPILLQFHLLSFKSFIISFTENYAHLPKLLYPLQCPVSQLFNVVISVHALKCYQTPPGSYSILQTRKALSPLLTSYFKNPRPVNYTSFCTRGSESSQSRCQVEGFSTLAREPMDFKKPKHQSIPTKPGGVSSL